MPNQLESQSPTLLQEDFLLRVTASLRSEMSPFELDETIRELRSHLIASAAAFEEVGLSPYEAMRAAIQRFGEPEKIDKDLAREARKSKANPAARTTIGWAALVCGPLMVGGDYLMVITGVVSSQSDGMLPIGMVTGAIIGIALNRRMRYPLIAAIRAAILVPSVLALVCMALNRGLLEPKLLFASFIFYGGAAFFTGLLAAWGRHVLERHYMANNRPSISQ